MTREIPLAEVKKHDNQNSVWMVIHNDVFDVTPFLDEHPGGADSLLDFAGKDGTDSFEDVGHSDDARELMKKYKIGTIATHERIAASAGTGHNICYKEKTTKKFNNRSDNNDFSAPESDSKKSLKDLHVPVKDESPNPRSSCKISRCSETGLNNQLSQNFYVNEDSPQLPHNSRGPTTYLNREVIVMPASSDAKKDIGRDPKRDTKKEPVKSLRPFEGPSYDKEARSTVSVDTDNRRSDPQLEGRTYSSIPRERRPRGLPCVRSGFAGPSNGRLLTPASATYPSGRTVTDTTLYNARGWRQPPVSDPHNSSDKLKYALVALAGAVVIGLVLKKYMSA